MPPLCRVLESPKKTCIKVRSIQPFHFIHRAVQSTWDEQAGPLNWTFQPCILQVAQFMSRKFTPPWPIPRYFSTSSSSSPQQSLTSWKMDCSTTSQLLQVPIFQHMGWGVIVSWICFVRILEDQKKQMCQFLLQENVQTHFMSAHFLWLLQQWKTFYNTSMMAIQNGW